MNEMRLQVGQVLAGRYWLQEHLGRGSMGDVFLARHTKVSRAFAVKVLHPELLSNPKLCARFEREAELAGKLRHRNVISVIDVGETARSRYIVMELAQGESLGALIGQGPVESQRAIELLRQICDGLHHAHERDLIHRDLKPDNIIVERSGTAETPRIVDFGLAILRDGASPDDGARLTTRGVVMGTPHYLAPESAMGRSVDRRADLFALGVIMYEMLSGAMPFDGDGVQVATANLGAPTPAMRTRAPDVAVDPLLEALTHKLLAKRPEQRPATAHEVGRLLALITSDRKAAAVALGVAATPGHPIDLAPVAVASVALSPVAVPAVPLSPDLPAGHAPAPSQRDVPTDELLRLTQGSRRTVAVAAALVLVLGAGVAGLAWRGTERAEAGIPAPAAPLAMAVEPGLVRATPLELPPPRSQIRVTPPPTLRLAASTAVATRAPAASRRAAGPTPPAQTTLPEAPPAALEFAPQVEPPEPPVEAGPASSETVLRLYASLGRQLKTISDRRDLSVDDLWQRYRRLRIQEAITTSSQRADAMNVLSAIEREISSRF